MKLSEYVKGLVIGAIGGLISSFIYEVKGMDIFSTGYLIAVLIILILIFIVGCFGWNIISKIESRTKK